MRNISLITYGQQWTNSNKSSTTIGMNELIVVDFHVGDCWRHMATHKDDVKNRKTSLEGGGRCDAEFELKRSNKLKPASIGRQITHMCMLD